MSEIIEKGYVECVLLEELFFDNGCIWYIFYYGVYYLKKLGKIRVVFDVSVECRGEFFNKYLL